MQSIVFTGRLAADPVIAPDGGKATFRLIENRGVDAQGAKRTNGVNCVSFNPGFNTRVLGRALAKGCEATATGRFQDRAYTARDGTQRTSKDLVIDDLEIHDWAEDRGDARQPA